MDRRDQKQNRFRQRGLSMVEMMVALVLGLFVVLAVLKTFTSAVRTYEMTEDMARIQENGRFAIEYLKRDIRQAGFWGCIQHLSAITNHLNDGGGSIPYSFTEGVSGAESSLMDGSTGYAANTTTTLLSDSILFSGGGFGNSPVSVTREAPATAESLQITYNSGIQENDIIVITDCKTADILQVTGINDGKNKSSCTDEEILNGSNGCADVIQHNTGSVEEGPGNDKDVDMSTDDYHGAAVSNAFRITNSYYEIKAGTSGEPALYRNGDEELVEGVESMQFLYGIASGSDKSVDFYETFDPINADDIVSVKVSLLVRGFATNMTDVPITFELDDDGTGDKSFTAQDNRLRKVFTSTVAIRNRVD